MIHYNVKIYLKKTIDCIQIVIFLIYIFTENKLISGHDISEGGFITTVLEMGIGGIRGLEIDLKVENNVSAIEALFNEELGIVIEVSQSNVDYVLNEYKKQGVQPKVIGKTGKYGMESQVSKTCSIKYYKTKNYKLLFYPSGLIIF